MSSDTVFFVQNSFASLFPDAKLRNVQSNKHTFSYICKNKNNYNVYHIIPATTGQLAETPIVGNVECIPNTIPIHPIVGNVATDVLGWWEF